MLPQATVTAIHLPTGIRTVQTSDEQGAFRFAALAAGGPYALQVVRPHYRPQVLNNVFLQVGKSSKISLTLLAEVVVVAASRVEETIGQVPVTIEKLDQRQVEQLTTPDLVAGLGRFKGIDISSSSMLTTGFSTRGFNSSRSERVIQLADYMDTQLPSLGTYFGNWQGTPELAIASVEIVHGPASALYGANAFNGVLLTNTKDAFADPGLSVRLRGGNRNLLDGQLRYAVKLGSRLAFQVAAGGMRADDFVADNEEATSRLITPNNNARGSALGYDAVSRYGDASTTFGPTGGALNGKTVFLPGYSEKDLVAGDDRTHNIKVMPSLAFKVSETVRATADYKYTQATTTYQSASRYRFVNGGAHQARLRVEGRDWAVRGFTTQEFSGNSDDPSTPGAYNLGFLGGFLQTRLVPNTYAAAPGQPAQLPFANNYFQVFARSYNTRFATNGGDADAAADFARAEANRLSPQLQPGTPDFEVARARILQSSTPGQGARLVLRSILNEGSGQYTFRNPFADLTVGGVYREYRLGSNGSVFGEPDNARVNINYEYGGYAQASKSLFDNHLKLAAAGRYDRFRNFGGAFSPRASAVVSLGANQEHNFRASFSQAFRAPTQTDQYLRVDVGRALLLGNAAGVGGRANGFEGFTSALAPYAAGALKLEKVTSLEGGYRAQLAKKLYIDADYYYNRYNDFIATQNFIGKEDGTAPTLAEVGAAQAVGFQSGAVRVIQISANVSKTVESHGAGLTLGYVFTPALALSGNYSFNQLLTKDFAVGTQSFFNTPTHKFNVGLDGQALGRTLSYNLNYRWVQGYLYESTFATGDLPEAQTVDAQVGYTVKKLHTTVQAGGTNLLDARNVQVYGAPNYGRLAYVGLLFDLK